MAVDPVRSYTMSRIRSVSAIEVLPRRLVGMYLRHQPRGVFGRPDFANKARRIALFLDGCFWHGCPRHFKIPKTNADFWGEKIARNRRRDREVGRILRKAGWTVLRMWEHGLKNPPKKKALQRRKGSV